VIVRDFVYLDVDQLESMYSQVFGHVVREHQILRSEQSSQEASEGARGFGTIEEESRGTRTSNLDSRRGPAHHRMYTDMLTALQKSIVKVDRETDLGDSATVEQLSNAVLVEASGAASFLDLQRADRVMGGFNEFGEDITWSFMIGSFPYAALAEAVRDTAAQKKAKGSPKAQKKKSGKPNPVPDELKIASEIMREIEKAESNLPEFAAQRGLRVYSGTVDRIRSFIRRMYEDAIMFSVRVSPHAAAVAALNENFLRDGRELTWRNYGTTFDGEWTVVGQFTRASEVANVLDDEDEGAVGSGEDDAPGLAEQVNQALMTEGAETGESDPGGGVDDAVGHGQFSRLVKQMMSPIENGATYFLTETPYQAMIRPLAIYRERVVPQPESEDESDSA